jgi:hypothetical protein
MTAPWKSGPWSNSCWPLYVVEFEPLARFALDRVVVIGFVQHAILHPGSDDFPALGFGAIGAMRPKVLASVMARSKHTEEAGSFWGMDAYVFV